MQKSTISVDNLDIDVYSLNTVIVGTGCAGFNAADTLYDLGQRDIAIVTEGVNSGTSRNTGSDKQTYYKMTLSGDAPDSVGEMAKTYFSGGCMHGDIALVEAALSARCFHKLAGIGVPFPHNRYGEYVGYKTDHDPRQRATSAGPLTSRFMTEKLEEQVVHKEIHIFDRYQVIAVLTQDDGRQTADGRRQQDDGKKAVGLLAVDLSQTHRPHFGFTLFNCTNIVWAVGGPAGMYADSVYPESQTGTSGMAYEAGAKGINLTESQYGLASVKFRWNVSGTYQQVIPRYISTDKDGNDPQEFLDTYFPSPGTMMDAVFLKGYQWPFDPRKIDHWGSSLIDILVYNETQMKGRRVWLDYRSNPTRCCPAHNAPTRSSNESGGLDFSLCREETYTYLKNSNALFGKPIDRLARMNPPAIQLYQNNGIDLYTEMLEIAVCAQHNNGGLLGNIWSESNLRHFFPVGEANGVFGIYRPGGSALNSTQVSSLRAAQYIAAHYTNSPLPVETFVDTVQEQFRKKFFFAQRYKRYKGHGEEEPKPLCPSSPCEEQHEVLARRTVMQKRMTGCGAHIRSLDKIEQAIGACLEELRAGETADGRRQTAAEAAAEATEAADDGWGENAVRRQVCINSVIPAQAGIQTRDSQPVFLDSGLRRNDKKSKLVDGLGENGEAIVHAFTNRDILITQYVYLCAVREYIRKGGGSRGSYLIQDKSGTLPLESLPEVFRFSLDNGELSSSVCEIAYDAESMKCACEWKPVRPIPAEDNWFENIWAEYRKGEVIR